MSTHMVVSFHRSIYITYLNITFKNFLIGINTHYLSRWICGYMLMSVKGGRGLPFAETQPIPRAASASPAE